MTTAHAEPIANRIFDQVVDFFHNYEHDPKGLNHCIGSDANPYHIHHVRIAGVSTVQHVIDLAYARGHGGGNHEQWFHFALPLRGGHWLEKGVKIPPPPRDLWMTKTFYGSRRRPNVRILHFQRKPGGGKQRLGSGDWEQTTNRQQRRLTRAYDAWSARTRRALIDSAKRGGTIAQQSAILEQALRELEADLNGVLEVGTKQAARQGAGERIDLPAVRATIAQHEQENRELLAASLIPAIGGALIVEVVRGASRDAKRLQGAFGAVRSAPGRMAGRSWVLIFETQKAVGKQRQTERKAKGLAIEQVRWVIDPRAEHCVDSPGFHGCPGLAGEYPSWDDLPTVPAGEVTCRGNCRCHIEVFRDGQWRRGVIED